MQKVSIVIPVYNSSSYLPRCIESIINQSYKNIELLLIDDGSLDNSLAICKSYEAKYPNKIAVFHKDNSGASDTRAFGVAKASGEWISFVDSDDALPYNAIELLVNKTINTDSDIILGGWYKILTNGEKVIRKICINGTVSPEMYIDALLSLKCYAGPVGKLFKHSLFNSFTFDIDKSISRNEDLIMNIRLATQAKMVSVFPKLEVYWYYENLNSATTKSTEVAMWDKVMFELKRSLEPTFQEKIDYYLCAVIYKLLSKGALSNIENSKFYESIFKYTVANHRGISLYANYFYNNSKILEFRILTHRILRNLKQFILQIPIYWSFFKS